MRKIIILKRKIRHLYNQNGNVKLLLINFLRYANYSTLNSFPEEDLDLRVLPSVNTNKRRSEEHIEVTPSKKSKAEKFDAYVYNMINVCAY